MLLYFWFCCHVLEFACVFGFTVMFSDLLLHFFGLLMCLRLKAHSKSVMLNVY